MALTNTFTFPVSQGSYDSGTRVHYCPSCYSVAKVAQTTDLECIACIPTNGVYNTMPAANYNSQLEQFEWTR